MTNAELIAKIKAEVERRIKRNKEEYAPGGLFEVQDNLTKLLSFLSTLESEKPMELEEEISRTYHDGSVADTSDLDHVSYENIAHHFYELGCRRTAEKYDEIEYNRQRAEESPLPEDTVLFNKGVEEGRRLAEEEQADLFTIVALDAAQRAREQMMKVAVNGWLDEDNEPPYDLNVVCEEKIPFGKFKHGDKVKLIIIKEE